MASSRVIKNIMKAIRVRQFGGPEVLKVEENLPVPQPDDNQVHLHTMLFVRDRPFNLQGEGVMVFFFRSEIFFSDNTKVRIIFFCRARCEIFFQNLTLGYMTKTLNQIIFFPPPKSEYFF